MKTLCRPLLALLLMAPVSAHAAEFVFYGRSGDAIELDFGSLPGVPAGATYSGLVTGRRSHPLLTSTDLSRGNFSQDGRFWAFPDPRRSDAASGDADPDSRGFQGEITGSLEINGERKTWAIRVQPGFSGAGPGSVGQSLEGLGRTNDPLHVAQQRQRLAYFGFRTEGGAPLAVSGVFDSEADEALRTFQAAFVGGLNTTQSQVDGIIGPNTAGWLNAPNAPRWDELIDPDPQAPGTFSVGRMIGDYDLLPSRDSGTGARTGNTPQIERFGTNWAIEAFAAGSALAKERTGITQLMNGMSTDDGYGSAAFHSTHRAGMDVDVHVDVSTWNQGNGIVSATEQGVIDSAIALIDAGLAGGPDRGRVSRIISSNADILAGIAAARPTVALSNDSSTVHENHLHVDIGPPPQQAALANLSGDLNFDDRVDLRDYTVWRDGFGSVYDNTDYADWLINFGAARAPSGVGVPEPASALLLLIACGAATRLGATWR